MEKNYRERSPIKVISDQNEENPERKVAKKGYKRPKRRNPRRKVANKGYKRPKQRKTRKKGLQ